MWTGTISKLVAGIGIRVVGTVGDGYKYLPPCSSLMCMSACRPSSVIILLIVLMCLCVYVCLCSSMIVC